MKVVWKFRWMILMFLVGSVYAEEPSILDAGEISLNGTIIIDTDSTVNVKKMMRKVYRKYNRHKPKKHPHIASAYFRETGKYNGKYVFFHESRGYSIFLGLRPKEPSLAKYWIFPRAALFTNYKFFPDQSRISDMDPDFEDKIKTKDTDQTNDRRLVGFGHSENNYRRFQEYGPLSRKYRRKFKYRLDSTFMDNRIRFSKVHFERDNFTGFLVINNEDLKVVTAEYKSDKLLPNPNKENADVEVKLTFSYDEDTPYISEMCSESSYEGLTTSNYLKILSPNFTGFDVTYDEYWGFSTVVVESHIDYNPNEWPDISYYQNEEYVKIKKDLIINERDLEQQFLENSNQWLNASPSRSGFKIAARKIRELKPYFE